LLINKKRYVKKLDGKELKKPS